MKHNRRSLLAASALALAPAMSRAERPTPKGFAGLRGIELGIATICVDGFANRHHEPALEFIPSLGFKNVELNLWYADQITPAYVDRLKVRCRSAGLMPISVQATGFGGEGRSGVIKDVAHKLMMIEHARRLDCRVVKFTGSRRGTQGGLQTVIDVCREIATAAEEAGVLVVLENHARNNLETIDDYERVFAAIDSPNVGLCLDTGHFEGSGIRLADVLDRFADRTLHVDLKDCREFGAGHDTVPFGQGVTNFDAFLGRLLDTGYQGYLVVEQAWSEPKGDWKSDLAAAHGRFRRWENPS